MSEHGKRVLDVLLQEHGAADDGVLIERLTAAVRGLHLHQSLIERMQTAVGVALRRVLEHDPQRGIQLVVSARRSPAEDGRRSASWGFFLIEKRAQTATPHSIEVMLYPEGEGERLDSG